MPNVYYGSFLGMDIDYCDASCVMFGVPFDGTVSNRPGTRFAASSMRYESNAIETYSPYLDRDLGDVACHDAGDLELPFGNTTRCLNLVKDYVRSLIKDEKLPVMVGGEHLVTLPVIEALHEKYEDLVVIHLDAHTDLREDYLGEKLSHATVMRRIWEKLGDGRIYQFGIRSGERYEFEWAKKHVIMNKYNVDSLKDIVSVLEGKPVYITIDLDVLDPSVFPGTGTPEPGGISFMDLMNVFNSIKDMNVVGADLVELSPAFDPNGISVVTACKILRELVLAIS